FAALREEKTIPPLGPLKGGGGRSSPPVPFSPAGRDQDAFSPAGRVLRRVLLPGTRRRGVPSYFYALTPGSISSGASTSSPDMSGAAFYCKCAPLSHSKTCYTSSVILGLGVSPMRRREFIALVGSSVAVWPLAAHAQQPGKTPRVGYIRAGTPRNDPFREEFVRGMRDLGYVEGRN